MSDVLLVDRRVDHAVLTLNRPDKRNALSIELRDAISDALDTLAADDTVKCVVLTGAGSVFSAGFDLSEFETRGRRRGVRREVVVVERSLPRHRAALPAADDRRDQRPRARRRLRPRGAVRPAHRDHNRSLRAPRAHVRRCRVRTTARPRRRRDRARADDRRSRSLGARRARVASRRAKSSSPTISPPPPTRSSSACVSPHATCWRAPRPRPSAAPASAPSPQRSTSNPRPRPAYRRTQRVRPGITRGSRTWGRRRRGRSGRSRGRRHSLRTRGRVRRRGR